MARRLIVAVAALTALAAASAALAGPTSTVAPKLTGAISFSNTITCVPGTFTPAPASVTYAWTAGGSPLPNATTSRLKLDQPSFLSYAIACSVTATDAAGSPTTVSTPAVRVAPGATTISITSVKVRKKGTFVIKGQIGPKELISGSFGTKPAEVAATRYLKDAQVVLDRKAPAFGPKAVYQLSDGTAKVDSHGRFAATGHDRAGRRKVIVRFFCGHNCVGIWAAAETTRTINVTPGYTGPGGTSVGVG